MAKDILDAIRQAEEDSGKRELEARESAKKKIDDAEAQAKQMIIDAQLKADAEAEKRYEAARIDGENELIKARSAAKTKCDLIESTAEKNRDRVVDDAVNFLLN